jgi:uncharacterized protein (TIGR03905 family)
MQFSYQPSGVCSRGITFELEDGKVHNVRFYGGCAGNTAGISALVEGMTPQEVEKRLSGIRCGFKPTSCPDQLTKALRQAMAQANGEK